MVVLAGADLVLADRVVRAGALSIVDGRIGVIATSVDAVPSQVVSLPGHTVVPGFIDVHVHGLDGTDVLDEADAVARIAARMPRHGVTAFCPTTVACAPDDLRRVLAQVERCRAQSPSGSARVLPAHLGPDGASIGGTIAPNRGFQYCDVA